jgi:hypothetical protein
LSQYGEASNHSTVPTIMAIFIAPSPRRPIKPGDPGVPP